ncbi:LysR family transcriptional regulator [Leisingera sp. ANG-Vp]|uniref:LysR family transcriptional regulator n=1 Tax=Leisingera sp. ANG-Vp TaxID=1577896 RepID=UPI00068C1A2A|nr:LysR family transcriptional regulator [Leisingera sp. ANG-Vp]
MNWDDARFLLGLARAGSLTAAARLLRADKSTVARRLAALEQALGFALTEREGNGALRLTAAGRGALRHAEAMGDAAQALQAMGQDEAVQFAGTVRLTAVPLIVNHLLLPQLPDLLSAAPGLRVELASDPRDLSLPEGEADIALRFARPAGTGQGVLARKIAVLPYAAYAAQQAGPDLPWLGYDPRMGFLPQAEAVDAAARQPGETLSPACFNDAETLFLSVLAGQGKTLLPRLVGSANANLRELPCPVPLPERELWLMVRRDLRGLERIRRTVAWLEGVFAAPGPG